jgi:hypothetical protein
MENELEKIQKRNIRVELDKAWEISGTRKIIIACLTYVVAVLWLYVIGNEAPLLNGLVPVGGYLLSTLSLPILKKWWIKNQ